MIDHRIPMMGRSPNVFAALDAGTRAAGNQNALMREYQGQNLFRQYGAQAMQGNPNALAQIAGFDPVMAQGMDINRQENRRADERLGMDRERLQMLRAETARAVREAEDKADAERQVRMMEKAFRAMDVGMRTGDMAAVRQGLGMFGLEDMDNLEEAMEVAATYLAGGVEGLASAYLPQQAGGSVDVQSSEVLPGGKGAMTVMRDGSIRVTTAAGETLQGSAAQQYAEEAFRLRAELEREVYGARREGTNEAEARTGADAAAAGERGQQGVKLAAEFFGEARTVRSSLGNIRDAIRAIDEGAKSGVVYNMLPNITVASATLANAANRLGLDVIGSVTFGALSEGEMRLAMDTAVPRDLEAAELRVWLERKRAAQEKALEGIEEAIIHFDRGGTMQEWTQKMRALQNTPAPTTPSLAAQTNAASAYQGMTMDDLLANVPKTEQEAAEWNRRFDELEANQ